MSEKERVSYYLPLLGQIDCHLHAESVQIYRTLENKKEIDRLKLVPQLGAVAGVWEGTRHTKWEYIVLLMFLIQSCKKFPDFQLNSKIKLGNSLTVSSAQELLNCWSLLLQTGHLFWTFSGERILLEEISQNEGLIQEILSSIKTPEVKVWAKDVMTKCNHYQFNKVLVYYRLSRYIQDDSLNDLASHMIDAYILPSENQALEKAKKLYQKLRRLTFLTLDVENSTAIASLRIGRILRERQTLERILLSTQSTEDELVSVEKYLVQHVYLGKEVLINVAQLEDGLLKRLRSGLSNNNLRYVVGELAKSSFLNSERNTKLRIFARFVIDINPILKAYVPTLLNPLQQKKRANQWAKRHGVCLKLSYEVDASDQLVVFQVHANGDNLFQGTSAISYAFRFIDSLISDVSKRLKIGDYSSVQQFIGLDKNLEVILLSTVDHILRRELRWEWDGRFGDKRVAISPSTSESDMNEALPRHFREKHPISSKQTHELMSTLKSVKGLYAGPVLFTTAGLRGFDRDGKNPVVEFDGIAVTRDRRKNEIIVTLVEAKDQRRGGEKDARRALSEKTSRVKVKEGVPVGKINSKNEANKAWAWRHIRMPYSNKDKRS